MPLGHVLTHVHADVARHAGQADILREGMDAAAGWWSPGDNLPTDDGFPAHVDRLTALAEQFT